MTQLPELVLMDINLPGINGYEALEILKQNDKTRDIPVIAVSANAMPKDISRGKAAGFNNYITKPFKIDELMKKINQALS